MKRRACRRHATNSSINWMQPLLQQLEVRVVPATFLVDNLSDPLENVNNPLPGTLRYAVEQANSSPNPGGPDDITIIKMGKIPMSAPMAISEAVVLDPFGASEVVIDMSQMSEPGPAFKVCSGLPSDTMPITFTGLTVTGAKGFPAIMAMDRDVIIQNSEVTGNTNSGSGGAVYFSSTNYNHLTILNSTIAGNISGGDGGGVFLKDHVAVNITNSTIANNTAADRGGAIAAANWLSGNSFVLQNSTISGNLANGLQGGGLSFPTGGPNLTIISSIVSGNLNPGSPDISAGTVDLLYSAVFSPNGFALSPTSTNNLPFGTNLALGPLGDNGGETRTFALSAASPAINAGNANLTTLLTSITASTNTFDVNNSTRLAVGMLIQIDAEVMLIGDISGVTVVVQRAQLGTTATPHTSGTFLTLPNDQRGLGFARVAANIADIGGVERSPIPYAKSKRFDVKTAGAPTFNVVVTYFDDVGINISTIDINDVKVNGPGFPSPASPLNFSTAGAGTSVTVTYTFSAPGGAFDPTDIGTYTTTIQPNQVFDVDALPNAVPAVSVGDFFVKIPVPVVVDEASDVDDGNITVGHLSLREAVGITNALKVGNAATITFDAKVFGSATTIQLGSGSIAISAPVSIYGPAAQLTLDGLNLSRIFAIDIAGTIESVFIKNLTLTKGNASTGRGGGVFVQDDNVTFIDCTISNCKSFFDGGGIATGLGGSVTLIRSTVSGNMSGTSGVGGGAGVYMYGNGGLIIENSTISGNTCASSTGGGGGIEVFRGYIAITSIVNSTISGNFASIGGGAYLQDWKGSFSVFNSTITNNTATGAAGGGGIAVDGVGTVAGSLLLSSSILAANAAANAPDLLFLAPLPTQNVPGDNNLVGVGNSGNFTLTGVGNLTGTLAAPLNPGLNPLANNGGPTQTHSLQAGSPAINAGNNVLCLQFDQRGFALDPVQTLSIGSFGSNIIPPPTVVSTSINGPVGGAQRSMVTSLQITFSKPVSLPLGANAAFQLNRVGPGGPNGLVNVNAVIVGNVVTLTFLPGGPVGIDPAGSLTDGLYQLTIVASNVQSFSGILDGDGNGLPGGNFVTTTIGPSRIFRLYGDADGNGIVDGIDFGAFRLAYNTNNFAFDYDGNGVIDGLDFGQFRIRFGMMI